MYNTKEEVTNTIINEKNILIVQDLDGVCIPLVKDPMKRVISDKYVRSAGKLAGELAVLRIRPSRVERLIEEKESGAKSLKRLQQRLRIVLMVTQLGVTISLVSTGWLINDLAKTFWPKQSQTSHIWEFIFFMIVLLNCSQTQMIK